MEREGGDIGREWRETGRETGRQGERGGGETARERSESKGWKRIVHGERES